jgi:hypothetical protein
MTTSIVTTTEDVTVSQVSGSRRDGYFMLSYIMLHNLGLYSGREALRGINVKTNGSFWKLIFSLIEHC